MSFSPFDSRVTVVVPICVLVSESILVTLAIRPGIYWWIFFQAEDGIRDAQESRGLGDVYMRQPQFFKFSENIIHLYRKI